MISKINSVNNRISFRSNLDESKRPTTNVYLAHSENDNDVFVRKYVREHIEDTLGVPYKYADVLGRMSAYDIRMYLNTPIEEKPAQATIKKEIKFDEKYLSDYGYAYCNPRRKNELYSGARLITKPGVLEAAKKAGVKTVLSLEMLGEDHYREPVEETGMNFIQLNDIGNKTLRIFDIIPTYHEKNPKVIARLTTRPELWQTLNLDGTKAEKIDPMVEDVQAFIDILNGDNEDYPLPLYYGCQWGTNRTFAWNHFYNILKDADRTQPLSEDKVKQLIELRDLMEDAYY